MCFPTRTAAWTACAFAGACWRAWWWVNLKRFGRLNDDVNLWKCTHTLELSGPHQSERGLSKELGPRLTRRGQWWRHICIENYPHLWESDSARKQRRTMGMFACNVAPFSKPHRMNWFWFLCLIWSIMRTLISIYFISFDKWALLLTFKHTYWSLLHFFNQHVAFLLLSFRFPA